MPPSKRILIAPLDWGLGHASRCVPVVHALQRQGAVVILGSSGRALNYLQRVFPELESVELPAYNIHYRHRSMIWNMLIQGPRIARTIIQEHHYLQKLIREKAIDGVLSDNRFGCYSRQVPSIFMTHQLHLTLPSLSAFPANAINHYFIRKFDACWVPDIAGEKRLSGRLAAPLTGMDMDYVGTLSQFKNEPTAPEIVYDHLLLLSGPEPQRTQLEELLLKQLADLPGRTLLVQGKTEIKQHYRLNDRVEVYSFLTGSDLQRAIAQANNIVCRSGYSTLMDLARLKRKALLIPTPGQPEQEYLARRMQSLQYCPYLSQSQLDLSKGIRSLKNYHGLPDNTCQPDALSQAVSNFLNRCERDR